MSGDGEDRRSFGRPVDVTEADIRELAGGRTKRVAAVARLKALRPVRPIGRPTSDDDAPAKVSGDEVATLRRGKRRPETFDRRLTPSDGPADPYDHDRNERVAAPTRRPTERTRS